MDLKDIWGENITSSSSKKERRGSRKVSLADAFSWLHGMLPEPKKVGSPSGLWTEFTWPSIRGVALFLGTLFLFLVLFGRLFHLQVVFGARNRKLSDNNHYRKQVIRAPRGIIYDRYGEPLVENKPGFSLVWDPPASSEHSYFSEAENLVEDSDFVERLAPMLELSPQELKSKLMQSKDGSPVVLATGLDRDDVLAVEMEFSIPFLSTEVVPLRNYLFGKEVAHVLGFTGEASLEDLQQFSGLDVGARVGKSGLEREFDLLIRGHPGERVLEVDVLGETVTEKAKKEAEPGQVLETSLDKDFQRVVFAELEKGVRDSDATGGAAVAMDPSNGEVLSLVSFPSYDPNHFVSGIDPSLYQEWKTDVRKPLFNRAVSGAYPPGSIFKPIVATAALGEGVITAKDVVNCKGAISVGSFVYRDWDLGGHGRVSLVDAIAKSCDIYFYTIGGGYGGFRGLGPDRIAIWARKFGLGSQLNLEFPWEATGLVPNPEWKEDVKGEQWYLGNTYHYSIGQGDLLVTPLQITNALAAIVNGGTLYRPTFLRGASNHYVLQENLASPEVLGNVQNGMQAVCQPGGTAYPFFDFPVEVGGKTGTAETGRSDSTHAWFFVYGPVDDVNIALTVFLENGGSGSHDAAPVARRILDWYFKNR
ncbi:MAG: penicillin-binding protein 2 [Patescibacteria group bacterium]|nr:penicillin-binding protein 2 [Patescibacteria group bacterium]